MLGKSIANTQQSWNDMRQQWSHFCPKKWISSCWNPHRNLINLLCQREVCRLFGTYYFDRNILFYLPELWSKFGRWSNGPLLSPPPTPLFLQPPPPLMYFFTCFIKQKTKTRHGFAFERIWWPYIGHSRGRNISFRKIFPSYHFL